MRSDSDEPSAGLSQHPLREGRDRRLRQALAHYRLPPEQRPQSTSKPKPGYTRRGMPRLYKPGRDHALSYSRQAYSHFQQLVLAARHCVAWFHDCELHGEHDLFPPMVEDCRSGVAAYVHWFKGVQGPPRGRPLPWLLPAGYACPPGSLPGRRRQCSLPRVRSCPLGTSGRAMLGSPRAGLVRSLSQALPP